MKKQALILQGWYQKPNSNWYPWLKRELENRGYTVFLPDLPTMHTDLPDMEKQLAFIERLIVIDDNTIIVGHSLGALLGLRLAEKFFFSKLFLVAGWDFDDDLEPDHKLFWKTGIDHAKVKKHVKYIYCISSDNDPYTTTNDAKAMNKRLTGKFILIKDAGHFTEKDGITTIPQLLSHV